MIDLLTPSSAPKHKSATTAAPASAENVFAHVPHTASGHFLLYFYAAVHRLLSHVRRLAKHGGDDLDVTFLKYPFLGHYNGEISAHLSGGKSWEIGPQWWESAIAAWEAARPTDGRDRPPRLPLQNLAREAVLSYRSRVAMLLVGLVEEDSRFGTVLADLQAPLPHRRPTLEFISRAMADDTHTGVTNDDPLDPSAVCRELVAAGFVEVLNRDAPRSEWALRVPPILWEALRSHSAADPAPWCQLHESDKFPPIEGLAAPADFQDQIARLPALLASGRATGIILRGMPGSDRLRVLGAIARAMGRSVLEVTTPPSREAKDPAESHRSLDHLGPLCCLTGAMPVLRYDLPPGETAGVPSPTGYKGPIGIILGLEGGLTGRSIERAVTLTVPIPNAEQRRQLWNSALGDNISESLGLIIERFQIPAGYIKEAAVLATARAALDGREVVTSEDVRQACRSLNRQTLDTLATRLECHGTWSELVLADNAIEKLREVERRCRHRERLLSRLGPAFGPPAAGNRGVRALLTGPSGTGKTLAARILAAELGKDLYRVDLAALINKYIGESEKNMHRLLSHAECHDIVLLLDEGDSVMSKRTDVRTSNDRYANLETNYLLQRLETYQGIVLVTTNLGDNIDQAFQRRMDAVVSFAAPGAVERLRIWQLHLPENHTVPAENLHEVAVRCLLTGGQIRNAAQQAVLIGLDDKGPLMTWNHLATAILSEYRKAGAVCPLPGATREKQGNSRAASRGSHVSFAAAIQ
jgi:hypothetical protein